MLTVKVNGREEKLNIGCRTFVSLGELLKLLTQDDSVVLLNGTKVERQEYFHTFVKGGDVLVFSAQY